MKQYYEILWLQDWASLQEVKEAFRKLSLSTHPDKGWSEYLFKIINGAYQELLNSFKEWSNKETETSFILLAWTEKKSIDSNKIVEHICSEIFNTFKSLNYNLFTKWIKFKYLMIIVRTYNNSKLVQSKDLHSIGLTSVFKFDTSYDICKHLCSLHWIDINQEWFDASIRQLLIRLAAKDIVKENWWMAFNSSWTDEISNSNDTIDIKDHDKFQRRQESNYGKLKKSYTKVDSNDISHTTTSDKILNTFFIIGCIALIIKWIGIALWYM